MTEIMAHLRQKPLNVDLRTIKDSDTAELLKQPDEDWRLENAMIVSYYKQVQSELDSVKYEDVKAMLTYTVADSFSSNEWKQFATVLGIPDSELGGIEENARVHRLKPLYVVLDEVYPKLDAFFRKNTLGHLVSALLAMERIDVLTKIQTHVQGILSRHTTSQSCSALERLQESTPCRGQKRDSQSDVSNSIADSGVFSSGALSTDVETLEAAVPFGPNVPSNIPPTAATDAESGVSASKVTKDTNTPAPNSTTQEPDTSPTFDKYSAILDAYFPKGETETMKVFVTHHEDNFEEATRLAELLQEQHSCNVLVQGNLQVAYHFDQRVFEDIVERADAIVPILSKTYLENYEKPRHEGCAESEEASTTYQVYFHLNNRLVSSGFLCHMIFPARLQEVSYAEVRQHHIFKKSVLLWDNVPKLVHLMHGCKNMRNMRCVRGS